MESCEGRTYRWSCALCVAAREGVDLEEGLKGLKGLKGREFCFMWVRAVREREREVCAIGVV